MSGIISVPESMIAVAQIVAAVVVATVLAENNKAKNWRRIVLMCN